MSLIDAIPQTIKQIGAARAQGAAASGNWGVALGDIGNFLGSIPESRRRDRSLAMQEEMNNLRLTQAKREAAADQALQGAMSNALLPDGSIDQGKLAQGLAGTPAATKIPQLMESFNRMQESALRLRSATVSAAEAEDDSLGTIAYAASQVDDPHDKAGILAAGLASGIKKGTVQKDTANGVLASMLQDDGNPDPTKVNQTVKTLLAKSKEQRQLAATDTQKEAAAESARALAAERKSNQAIKDQTTALTNFSKQLAATTTKDRYTAVYNGIPAEYRNYFDAPEAWTKDSPQRAGLALMSPSDRIRMESEERLSKSAEQTAKHQTEMERIAASREKRLAENEGESGTKTERTNYKEFVSQYDKARTEERERTPMVLDQASQQLVAEAQAKGEKPPADYLLTKVKGEPPAYQPPPSFEKWQAMTPAERARVVREPNTRISDVELARRAGGAPSNQPTPAVPAPPAPAPAPTASRWKVGDAVMYQGKPMIVTGINPDGTVRVKAP